jgi:hypothetical protein
MNFHPWPCSSLRVSFPLAVLAFFLSTSSFAIGIDAAFELLKYEKEDFVNTGAVCEHVARLELQEDYPLNRFEIDIGVSYIAGDQVLGELDVVIRDRKTGTIPAIGEVKCWKNLKSGLEKAQEQEARFREALQAGRLSSSQAVSFTRFVEGGENPVSIQAGSFPASFDHFSIGQNGAKKVGYDRELEMTLEQLMELRKRLMGRKR